MNAMQRSAEDRFKSRKLFMGPEGMPFSESIKCLAESVESWKACVKRLDLIDPNLSDRIPIP